MAGRQRGHWRGVAAGWLLAGLLGALVVLAQETADPARLAGDNLGRTEADDGAPTGTPAALGAAGAVSLSFKLDRESVATLALYTPQGRLVRILGQCLPLPAGEHTVRWDGLDLFGNLVPAGRALELKVIHNQPLRAFYEFSVAAPKVAPWPGWFGTGAARRAGGWLGDHTGPSSAAALGDRVFLGCALAEHGDNLIAVNLAGEKLWGHKLSGWDGPSLLVPGRDVLYALDKARQTIYRVAPALGADEKGRPRVDAAKLYTSAAGRIETFAADGDRLLVLAQPAEARISPFRAAFNHDAIDFAASRPQVLDTRAPTEFMISPQEAFGNTFHRPGSPQNGAPLNVRGREARVLLVLKQPATVGALLLGAVPGAATTEVHAFTAARAFDPERDSPLREGAVGGELEAFGDGWTKLGEVAGDAPLAILPAGTAPVTAAVFCVTGRAGPAAGNDWKPRLALAQMLAARVERVPATPRVTVKAALAADSPAAKPGATGWRLRAAVPVSALNPVALVWDLGADTTLDGLALLNPANPEVRVDAYTGAPGSDPAAASDDTWQEVGSFKGGYTKKLRHLTASRNANAQLVALAERVTTRALRFRVLDGYRGGKWGEMKDDPTRVEVDEVLLLRLAGERAPRTAPPRVLCLVSAADGAVQQEWSGPEYDLSVVAGVPGAAGQFFAVRGGRLCRVTLDAATGKLASQPLNDLELKEPAGIAVSADRVAVSERSRRAAFVFDHGGKLFVTVGDRGPRKRGPWDPAAIEKPSGLALAADGSLWVTEDTYNPKRVSHFAADGRFLEEYLGPPMYGGGGHLDPNLKSFYYRSQEFALDWAAGSSRLANLNDYLWSEETPSQDASSFAYTSIGRPVYVQGRRYIVTGNTVCRLDGPTWRPCLVMGAAADNYFLRSKELWQRHWAALDLAGKLFLWCDRNDDGQYQIEEVELFTGKELGVDEPLRGLVCAPDLSFWGTNARLRPHAFTPSGSPLYRARDFTKFNYDALAPHYPRNYTLAGPKSAKPQYSGLKYVTHDGSLVQEGQPFVVQADGTLLGGAPEAGPSDFLPPIAGTVLDTPWSFPGGAPTASAIGEIAVVNSNNGYWYVWAAKYGVIVGRFFTGAAGGWGDGLPPVRGTEVTGRRQDWEGWGGDFVKGQDGRYYAQAGKGFHAISRIEGLDDFQVLSVPVTVAADAAALNATLRPVLKARTAAVERAASEGGRKELAAKRLAERAPNFKLDGVVADWGPRHQWQTLGAPAKAEAQGQFVDLAWDERGLYVAATGVGSLANAATDWRRPDLGGFALDLGWRPQAGNRAPDASAGDRRLLLARVQGQWTAVLHDYVAAAAPADAGLREASPLATATVARVRKLAATEYQAAVREDALPGADENVVDDGGLPAAPGAAGGAPGGRAPADGAKGPRWTAEVFLPWALLGVTPPATLRFDVGALPARGQGAPAYWANAAAGLSADPALALQPLPAAWGKVECK